jgi:hypothetical protein
MGFGNPRVGKFRRNPGLSMIKGLQRLQERAAATEVIGVILIE